MTGRTTLSNSERMALLVVLTLVATNALWVLCARYSGPLFALFFYSVITYLCWQQRHFRAGVIGGVGGFGIHAYELISRGMGELHGIESALFFINLVAPLALLYFSYRACQGLRE